MKADGAVELALVVGWDVQDGRVSGRAGQSQKGRNRVESSVRTPLTEIDGAIDDAGFVKGLLALETFVALAAVSRTSGRHAS